MYKRKSPVKSPSLFWDLESMLDIHHELYIVANLINWQVFEDSFSPLFSDVTGRRPKSIRLMVGLLILKHLRNVSDEQVVAQFRENAYYQYFCGMGSFTTSAPCASSELVHFRHCIGESGAELILKESIRVNLAIDDARRKKEDERSGKDGRGASAMRRRPRSSTLPSRRRTSHSPPTRSCSTRLSSIATGLRRMRASMSARLTGVR